LEAYLVQLDRVLERSAAAIAGHERFWSQINPSPLIASTIDDCLESGRDVGEGGCHYNAVGCIGAGLANAADSLLAIKQAVYKEGRFTLDELLAALRADFEGYEAMRAYLVHRVPKWGNGHPEADRLAQLVAGHYCYKIHSFVNERGGPYQAALYSFTFQWTLGRGTGALPDGKRAGKPLAPGVGPMVGRDRAGLTAMLESVHKIDFTETPNGSVLDVRLHPRSVAGLDGLLALTALVKTAFERGVYALQFNVVDGETLRAAQRDPEAYATLQVRVAGYSAYFVNLTPEVQDHLIRHSTHDL
jgi:formate C-acetyltransferase